MGVILLRLERERNSCGEEGLVQEGADSEAHVYSTLEGCITLEGSGARLHASIVER